MAQLRPPAELVEMIAKQRDRAAFAELFEQMGPKVKRYLLSQGTAEERADDLVQEVMLAVWRRAETFDARRSSLSTWVFAIARNKRIDVLRKEGRPEPDPDDPAFVQGPRDDLDAALDLAAAGTRLRAALDGLPEDQASVVRRAYFDDRSLSEIATESEVPLGTVKSRVRLAMTRLRQVFAVGESS